MSVLINKLSIRWGLNHIEKELEVYNNMPYLFSRDLYRESAVREFIRREGQAPAEEDLYHKDKKRPPKFRTHIKNLTTLKENDSAHFECKLMPYGDPTMKVEWYKDNQPLHHGKYCQQFTKTFK